MNHLMKRLLLTCILIAASTVTAFCDRTTIGVSVNTPDGGIRVPSVDLLYRQSGADFRVALGLSGGTLAILNEASIKAGLSVPLESLNSEFLALALVGVGNDYLMTYNQYATFAGAEAQYRLLLGFFEIGLTVSGRLGPYLGGYSWSYIGAGLAVGMGF